MLCISTVALGNTTTQNFVLSRLVNENKTEKVEMHSFHPWCPAVCVFCLVLFFDSARILQGCDLFRLPLCVVVHCEMQGRGDCRLPNPSNLSAEFTTPTLYQDVLEIARMNPSCTQHGMVVFSQRASLARTRAEWLMWVSRSACWWGVCQGKSLQSGGPFIYLSGCLDFSSFSSLPGGRQWGRRRCSLSTPSTYHVIVSTK